MADAEPKRWVVVKMLHNAIERTEAEITELKSGRLFVRDASGPDDSQEPVRAPVTVLPAPSPPVPPPVPVPSVPSKPETED